MTGLNKSYSELITIPTFEDRLCYLQTHSKVGGDIFGSYRYLVEQFLQGQPWKSLSGILLLEMVPAT